LEPKTGIGYTLWIVMNVGTVQARQHERQADVNGNEEYRTIDPFDRAIGKVRSKSAKLVAEDRKRRGIVPGFMRAKKGK